MTIDDSRSRHPSARPADNERPLVECETCGKYTRDLMGHVWLMHPPADVEERRRAQREYGKKRRKRAKPDNP